MKKKNPLFLNAALEVLLEHGKPLRVSDIYNEATEKKHLTSFGKTPKNTLRARLSEEIRQNGKNSIFIRVGPNKFGLREWIERGAIHEYKTKPFIEGLKDETIISIPRNTFGSLVDIFGFSKNYKRAMRIITNPKNWYLVPRSMADQRTELKQIVTYVILKDFNGKFLVYKRGRYTKTKDQLLNLLCIGFGGHVEAKDENLFEDIILSCARREIHEELKLRKLRIQDLKIIGIINDESSLLGVKHLGVVLTGILPKDFSINQKSTEQSINQLDLISENELWENFHELEFWSMLVARELITIPKGTNSIIIDQAKKFTLNIPLIIVGSISSGKSEICNYLSEKYNVPKISTSQLIAKLIEMPKFDEADRGVFQNKAEEFITGKTGHDKFVNEIIKIMKSYGEATVIIDGIRNISIYEELISKLEKHKLIYIETPKDMGFEFFKTRLGQTTNINEFRKRIEHGVENEVKLFKRIADVLIFNGGTKKSLFNAIDKWWKENV